MQAHQRRLVRPRSSQSDNSAADDSPVARCTGPSSIRGLRSGASLGSGMSGLMPMIPQQDEDAAVDYEMAAIDAAINAELEEQPELQQAAQRHKKRARPSCCRLHETPLSASAPDHR